MSLLLDALRRADEVARAPAPAADTTADVVARSVTDAPSPSAVQTPFAMTEAGRGGHRLVALAILALIGAALVGSGAWWWLQTPALGGALVIAPAADPAQAPAGDAAAGEAKPDAPSASAPNASVPIAPQSARRTPTAAAPERAARRGTAAVSDPAVPAVSATQQAAVRRGEPVELPLAEAYAAWRAGRLQEAERLYRQALAIDALQPDALLGLAAIAEARGERAEATVFYRRVLQSEPDHPVALAALAELAAGGDAAAQESVLRQALARRPQAAALHTALGRLLAAQQRWSEAQQAFASAWQLEPASAERAYDLAVALDRLRKPAAATQMYAQAVAQAGPGVGFDVDGARARLAALQASNAAEVR